MSFGPAQRSRTSVSGSRTDSFRSSRLLTALNIAMLAPMPIAREATTTAVQPRALSSTRAACRRSLSMTVERRIPEGLGLVRQKKSRTQEQEPPFACLLAFSCSALLLAQILRDEVVEARILGEAERPGAGGFEG